MLASLLNDNQRRHLAAYLDLLTDELRRLPPEAVTPAVTEALARVLASVGDLRTATGVERGARTPAAHRVQVLAETWAMRAHDLRAAKLDKYGAVAPDLAPVYDPLVDQLESALRELATASAEAEG